MTIHPAELAHQFAAIRAEVEDLVQDLSDEQLLWRPGPGAWSITECVAHLNRFDGESVAQIYPRVEEAKKAGCRREGPFRPRWFERVFIRASEPPAKLRIPAPKNYVPPPELDPLETMLEFQRIQHDLAFLVKDSTGLDWEAIAIPMPVRWVRFRLVARLAHVAAHDRRHLWQARGVRSKLP
jgi:hypothetical protein